MSMEDILVQDIEMKSRDWAVDIAIALFAFFFGCLQLVLAFSTIIFADQAFRDMVGYVSIAPTPVAYVVVAATTVPVVLRRRLAWIIYALVFGIYIVMQGSFAGYSLTMLGPMIGLFTIARYRPRVEVLVALIVPLALLLVVPMPAQSEGMALVLRIQNITYMGLAAFAGFAFRSYAEMLEQSRQRAIEAERTREEEAARRVEAERVRIAREIHDITAHSLSAVNIQAAAAQRTIDRDPAQAKEIMGQARMTAKSALDEIRAMVGVLRNAGQQTETAPAMGTERLDDLVSYARNAGLEVKLNREDYHRDSVPAFADLALYAIAREAVTNVVRHAGAKHLAIDVSSDVDSALLTVEDDGGGAIGDGGAFGGHGIEGMRERALALHGFLEAGNRAGGGFRVRARIPLQGRD